MNVIVSGATGLVGRAVVSVLRDGGHDVRRLIRGGGRLQRGDFAWDPVGETMDEGALEGVDAAVCLSGDNIGSGRWTGKKKSRILGSRMGTVSFLSDRLAAASRPSPTLVCASAVGYYGSHCGDTLLAEDSPVGKDFLAGVCEAWERAADAAREGGVRVIHLRFGVILDGRGGALARMKIPFRLGLGGRIGSGRQYMSWLSLADAVGIVRFVLESESLEGPINAVAPHAVTNLEFTKTLGRIFGRPVVFPMPASVLKLVMGEMGETLLLGSARAVPAKLEAAGYPFFYPGLESALRHALGK